MRGAGSSRGNELRQMHIADIGPLSALAGVCKLEPLPRLSGRAMSRQEKPAYSWAISFRNQFILRRIFRADYLLQDGLQPGQNLFNKSTRSSLNLLRPALLQIQHAHGIDEYNALRLHTGGHQ